MTSGVRGFVAGVVAGVALAAGAMAGSRLDVRAYAQESVQRPVYKIALENDRVRVRDVTFPPGGQDNGMHTHQYPHVGVIITAGTLQFKDPSGKVDTVKFDAGSVGYRDANVTHMTTNPGAEPMRVIEVELKK